MKRLAIDARESGTSTGRYIDKLVEYLHKLKPDLDVIILAKSDRIQFFKQIAPSFETISADFKEFTFAEQLGFKRQLKKLNADLVHFNAPQQPVLYRGKTVTTVHDLTTARFNNPSKNWLLFKTKQLVYKIVVKRVAHKSKKIIAISNFVKSDLISFTHINPDRVEVIYEAADKITEPPQAISRLKNAQFIMYVGRPTPHKNLNRLVEAFETLVKDKPEIKLVLVGKTDSNYEHLKKLVQRKNLTSQVIFTGFVSEAQLRWLYENCQTYVFPSLSEGFGLPALEAMAHGAPVVSSKATSLPEIYGQAAIYFNPVDITEMAFCIAQVLNDSKLRQELIAKGLKQADKYSWAQTATQTLEVYKTILKN